MDVIRPRILPGQQRFDVHRALGEHLADVGQRPIVSAATDGQPVNRHPPAFVHSGMPYGHPELAVPFGELPFHLPPNFIVNLRLDGQPDDQQTANHHGAGQQDAAQKGVCASQLSTLPFVHRL